jgi:hypothetical protein
MNPDDMRGLFNEALGGADPVPISGTDDIVAAGRRRVLRRRAAIGSGAIAGIAALAAALAIPMGLSGWPAPLDATGPGTGEPSVQEEETEAPELEEEESTESYTLPDDAALAEALVGGISEQFPGATVPQAAEVEFSAQEQTEAYAEGYHYGNDGTRIVYADATVNGEQVRFFLQVTPIESADDGGASQEPAEHYANCADFECEYSPLDDSTGLVHRTSVDVRPGPTSIEHRAADGWVVGVGAESLGSTEAPSIDFEALDAIVHSIR